MDQQTAAWCRLHLKRIGIELARLKARLDEHGIRLDDFLAGR